MSFFKKLNKNGKIVLIATVTLIISVSVYGYIAHCIRANDLDDAIALTFKECDLSNTGITFTTNGIEVHKDIFFCNPVVNWEMIPQSTALHLPHSGVIITPLREDHTKATYIIDHDTLYKEEWHIVHK